jgi:hypothetical protein
MNKRYINVKDIQRGVADTYLGVNGNGAVLSPNNSDEIDSAIAALNNQIDSIHDTLNSDYYVNIAPNYTFESNTTVSKNITGAYYNKIKEAVADNKMVMAAIVDGAVKTFNLIELGRYNLRFASYIIDANGVLTDYIVLTEVQDGFPPENVTVGYRLTYQSEYSTYPTADLTGYATEQWVEGKGYLTGVPSEYVTDDELNEAIAGLGGTDIPTVVISNGDANSTTPRVTGGDLDAVINAISENAPYIAYFVNVGTKYGVSGKKYLIQAADFNAVNNTGALYYHTEIDGGNHMDVQIFFRKENDVYTVFNITRQYHYYQEQLTSGVNIKTINGNSILGSGDLTIEGGGTTDLSGYVTETELNDTLDDYYTKDIADRYFAPKGQVIEYVEVYEGGNYLEARNEQGHSGLYLKVGRMGYGVSGLIDAQSTEQYLGDNYYTIEEIDSMVGDINTILENIIG